MPKAFNKKGSFESDVYDSSSWIITTLKNEICYGGATCRFTNVGFAPVGVETILSELDLD